MPTLRVALIGSDIEESLSPEIHRQLFPILNPRANSSWTAISYEKFGCENSDEAEGVILAMQMAGYNGANITMPYKATAATVCDELVGVASVMQSVNTVSFSEDRITGLSTDGAGFLAAYGALLDSYAELESTYVIIGAGGAARAIVYALVVSGGAKKVRLINRDSFRCAVLQSFIQDRFPEIDIECVNRDAFIRDGLSPQVFINATPIGTSATLGDSAEGIEIRSTDLVIDAVVMPVWTPLLQRAMQVKAQTGIGLAMLVQQAAFAQWYWLTGKTSASPLLTENECFEVIEALQFSIDF